MDSPASGTQKVNFSLLILGMHSAAMSFLGVKVPGEESGQPIEPMLAMQHIQFLEILEEKTSGNLTADEQNLIKKILTDLRLEFSRVTKKS